MKSRTCKGSNNQYLEEYLSESAAIIDAQRIKKEFGHELSAYLCRTCSYWHLTAVSKTKLCMFCTDSALFHKDLYPNQQEAEATARKIDKEKRIKLFAYRCPHTNGWHLTKRLK